MADSERAHEDARLRSFVMRCYPEVSIARIDVRRNDADLVTMTIHTARPDLVIGPGGQKVEEVRRVLEQKSGCKLQIDVLHEAAGGSHD
jgi:small subunit ribosomal protein S3